MSRRITIEEGAKAEYWLKSRKNLGSALASLLLYTLGIGCLLVILVIQSIAVMNAAGWDEAAQAYITGEQASSPTGEESTAP